MRKEGSKEVRKSKEVNKEVRKEGSLFPNCLYNEITNVYNIMIFNNPIQSSLCQLP